MNNSSGQNNNSLPLGGIYGDTKRIAVIFYWFITFILAGLIAGIFIVGVTDNRFATALIAIATIPVLSTYYLVHRQKFEFAAVFLSLVLISLNTVLATNSLGIHHISNIAYPAILIVASLVTRKRTMVLLTLFTLACLAWLVFGELSGAYTPGVLVRSMPGDFVSSAVIILLTAIMVRLLSETLFQSNLQLKKELKEKQLTEEKYRAIIENAIDGIFQSTPEGRFISVNPAMARMYGYATPEEMVNSITDISTQIYVEPNSRDILLQRLRNGEKITGYESLDYRKDGSTFWTAVNVQTILNADGSILYYEGTVENITDRKLAETVLRESEERYRTLFNGMLDGVYRSTHDGKFLDVNPAMIKMFGYDNKEQMLSLDIKKEMYFAPEERESLFLDTGQEKVDVFRMRRKDGTEIWVEDHGHYVHDKDGNVIYHEGILRDITPRLKIEAERERLIRELATKNAETETLRESLATIVGTFEFTEIIQHILDQIRRVIPYDSASVWRLEGNAQKFVAGRDLPAAIAESNFEFAADHTNSALPIIKGEVPYILNNNVQEELADFQRPPHNYVNSWLAIPLKTRGRIIGVIALDGKQKDQFNEHHAELAVTFADQLAIALENARLFSDLQTELADKKRLIAELESKNTELEHFTYTVSHDLKSPLVTMNGFLGYLEDDLVAGNIERVRIDKQRIKEAIDKMYTLLNELLELSRIGRITNPPQTVRFEDLAGEALDNVRGRIEARGVKVRLQSNLPSVYGDRQRLVEALQNLIDNAAKFMGNQSNPQIEIGQQGKEDGKPIFFVKDNGIGIAPEHQDRVFGLFNKLDTKSEGTGIGLAIVKRIIEVHGGRIWVESDAGKGATFHFTLSTESN